MKRHLLFLCIGAMACGTAGSQNIPSESSPFCKEGKALPAKFNDSDGFSNVVVQQHGYVKVYREVASPDLDWAIYDSYVFRYENGKRTLFSRAVIYAGSPIVFSMIEDEFGAVKDNTLALPDGFYVPSEPPLEDLEDFCGLVVDQQSAT